VLEAGGRRQLRLHGHTTAAGDRRQRSAARASHRLAARRPRLYATPRPLRPRPIPVSSQDRARIRLRAASRGGASDDQPPLQRTAHGVQRPPRRGVASYLRRFECAGGQWRPL